MRKIDPGDYPTVDQLERELNRALCRRKYCSTLRSTVCILVVVAAVAVLVSMLWVPVLQIYGSSMAPTLNSGEIVVSVKSSEFETGDVVAFFVQNKILVKRCIAKSGDWVDIKTDGTVLVNGEELDEPYISGRDLGECDLAFPYQVPESKIFVLGDHRRVSVDSRSEVVGCVAEEQIMGRVVFRVWPFSALGPIG